MLDDELELQQRRQEEIRLREGGQGDSDQRRLRERQQVQFVAGKSGIASHGRTSGARRLVFGHE